ncbi:MAG TPA: FAD-dependent oxidoreductase [Acidimicrobiales bacterium]|nr:FAD-dependent oxidoreductase [Acidimicrobiales bacterium]
MTASQSAPGPGDAVAVGSRTAPSRLVFGPHETNLCDGRAFSGRHVAYYARRAAAGVGIIVTETASVTANDWPYERAPLAQLAGPGWQAIARACASSSTLVLAGLGHAGGQGSSAYSQEVMWAPSPVADVVTREPPAALDEEGIAGLVVAFGRSAGAAMDAGMGGVELDAGAFSLLRQFHSGLTNLRGDAYGEDRLLFTRHVLAEVRRVVGPSGVVALRLSCDELAPWAGVTPEQAAGMVDALAGSVDLLTVVRGGPYSTSAYRPDAHVEAGFNRDLCRQMREAAAGRVPVVLQGSVVDPAMATEALGAGVCDLVEMTRALIADADLPAKVRSGRAGEVRPCIRCNQACRVRDPRNPLVSCVVDPASGHETEEPYAPTGGTLEPSAPTGGTEEPYAPTGGTEEPSAPTGGTEEPSAPTGGTEEPYAPTGRTEEPFAAPVLVVGGGPAGLECARVLALAGRRVRLVERSSALGGTLARAAVGPGRESLRQATDWLDSEVRRLGVEVDLGTEAEASQVREARQRGQAVVLATGSRPATDRYADAGVPVLDALSVLGDPALLPEGPVVVADTVGDAVGVNLAEWLATAHGRQVTLVCPDPVAGTQLSRTGDLADANGRLQRAGVTRQLRSLIRRIGEGAVDVEDCWTAAPARLPAASVVDCGHRLPDDSMYEELGDPDIIRIGDCVAPRSLLEAVLEGRRAALRLLEGLPGAHPGRIETAGPASPAEAGVTG